MSLNRYAARTDGNQAQIKRELEAMGFQVDIVKFPYDAVITGRVGGTGDVRSLRVEIKDKGGRLSTAEKKYHAESIHQETLLIAYSTEDILTWFQRI